MKTNVIIQGNSYTFIKEIEDNSVDLIYTDPPYQIEGICDSGKLRGMFAKEGRKSSYEKELYEITKGIDLSILDEFVRVMKKINIYIWCNKEQIYDYLTYFVKQKKCNWEVFIWAKDNPPPFLSGHYLKDKEYCLYFWQQGVKLKPTYENGKTVVSTAINSDDKKLYNHPTIKPLDFVKSHIESSTQPNDIVLDPFMGSGTTCVACKELERQYIGIEINPKYYEIAKDRLNGVTQKEKKANAVQMKLF